MQDFSGRMELDVLEGRYRGLLPAVELLVEGHLEHVVGEDVAELELAHVRFRAQLVRFACGYVQIGILRRRFGF